MRGWVEGVGIEGIWYLLRECSGETCLDVLEVPSFALRYGVRVDVCIREWVGA